MMLYLKDPTDFTRKVLNMVNTVSKVAENKVNTQKSVAIKKTIPFVIV